MSNEFKKQLIEAIKTNGKESSKSVKQQVYDYIVKANAEERYELCYQTNIVMIFKKRNAHINQILRTLVFKDNKLQRVKLNNKYYYLTTEKFNEMKKVKLIK